MSSTKRMSRNIICPRCGNIATIYERVEVKQNNNAYFIYEVKCENCGDFSLDGKEEVKARKEYERKMNELLHRLLQQ